MLKRKTYLDYLRVISAVAVVLVHVFTTARTDFPEHTGIQDCVSVVLINLLHFCVPIFLMITGALFLKEEKKISIRQLYFKYILRYVIILLSFGWAFSVIERVMNEGMSIGAVWNGFLDILNGKTWAHMWYIFMLIGVMMILPFVKILSEKLDKEKQVRNYYIILSITVCFVLPLIKDISGYSLPITVPIFSAYVFYLYLGHIMEEGIVKLKMNLLWVIVSMLFLIGAGIIQSNCNIEWAKQLGAYDSVVVMAMAVGVFGIFKQAEKKLKDSKLVELLASCSFGTYIVHMFFINVAYKILKFNIYDGWFILKSLLVFVICFVLSVMATYIMKKIPLIKRYV